MSSANPAVVAKPATGRLEVTVVLATGLNDKARGREVFATAGIADKLLWQTKKVLADEPAWTDTGVLACENPLDELQLTIWAEQEDKVRLACAARYAF